MEIQNRDTPPKRTGCPPLRDLSCSGYRLRFLYVDGYSGKVYCHIQKRGRWFWSNATDRPMERSEAVKAMTELEQHFPNAEDRTENPNKIQNTKL